MQNNGVGLFTNNIMSLSVDNNFAEAILVSARLAFCCETQQSHYHSTTCPAIGGSNIKGYLNARRNSNQEGN